MKSVEALMIVALLGMPLAIIPVLIGLEAADITRISSLTRY